MLFGQMNVILDSLTIGFVHDKLLSAWRCSVLRAKRTSTAAIGAEADLNLHEGQLEASIICRTETDSAFPCSAGFSGQFHEKVNGSFD